jgi:hypothetical protein
MEYSANIYGGATAAQTPISTIVPVSQLERFGSSG